MPFQRTAAVILFCVACTETSPGRKLASGLARGLIARDGAVAYLLDARRPDDATVPEDLLAGDLWLDDRKVGSGVSSGEGAYAFSPRSGELAFLASWRFREGEGELWVASPGSAPRQVAKAARSFVWSSRGELAVVARDALGFGARLVALPGIQAVAWAPDGRRLAARASAAAGGKLWVVDALSATAKEIAVATSDFSFSPDGAIAALGPPPPKGGDRPLLVDGVRIAEATAFTFSPDGREIALLSTSKQPGESSGDLYRIPRSGGAPRPVASRVTEWRWTSGGDLLCLARYDLRARAGTLTASSPGAPPREIAQRVQGFSIFGRRVLYLVQVPLKGDFKIELWALDLAAAETAPRRIDEGVYGWDLSPDGGTIYYKARCAGGSRSCALLRTGFSAGAAEVLAANAAGFDLSRDGARILVQQPHRGAPRAVDLAVISATGPAPDGLTPFVQEADPGSRFADAAGRKVAYAVIAAGKGGVFLADAP
jgi:dipeptidyl aminopeptidase/acylaminoacyl peptidase